MQAWQRRRIDLINVLNMFLVYCSRYGSIPDPYPLTSLADCADDVTIVPFHSRRDQLGERSDETAGQGSTSYQVVTYNTRNMWSSVVLLEFNVVGLSLDERNNIAPSSQISCFNH